MSKIWFTSDTHFGSQRTLELSKRPFKTVEEMDKAIIDNWNSVVKEDDTVYHLGDFGDYNKVKDLNGEIILIRGNYEHNDMLSINTLLNYGFIDVLDVYSKEISGYRINLVHEPSKAKNKKGVNLFGHIHKLQMVKKFGLNVGTDCHNFYPIDLDTVLFYHNAIQNYYDNEVFN